MAQQSLRIELETDRKAILQGTENPSISVLVSLHSSNAQPPPRPPATVVFLLDCSGTVRRFAFRGEEEKRWIELARERSELREVALDRRKGYEFTGKTLAEARQAVACPLSITAAALKKTTVGLRESDVCCLIGFATQAEMLYDGRRRLLRQSLEEVLTGIEQNPSAPNLGDGTRMREAARLAAEVLRADPTKKRLRHLVILTDGIIEDQAESLQELERIRSEGIAITAIGVGQEFDEEYLTRIADWTGGAYYYAPQADDIEVKLAEDFGVFSSVAARSLKLSARGLGGAVVNSFTQIAPQMRMFEEIRLRDDWFEVEVGDVSGSAGTGLVGEFALPWLREGQHTVGEIQLDWITPEGGEAQRSLHQVVLDCLPAGSDAPATNVKVERALLQLQVYRAERAAQWAQEFGRAGLSTARLREASQLLSKLGESELAERFERQASDVASERVDSDQTKSLKDWVRRLGRRPEAME